MSNVERVINKYMKYVSQIHINSGVLDMSNVERAINKYMKYVSVSLLYYIRVKL